ncbi:Tol-Pal system beta propeller repeat protein TolB [Wenxinia marina]|uniref:Tol-Pal system protein TolB n=1 Tax=Wenxinia marina DSM 24838 TaxID=1123501 RepID=A0A0D0PA94_9RHOB|nr:Tol-Pal system beta propeller repeat protein TolB [Wenxinia marina]KIQ68426.1 tol-pal system beta propeller repeat protein TolB [Wenxinia marina DSM 24838]GGL72352.1 protein TolB [Wenxinia marina]
MLKRLSSLAMALIAAAFLAAPATAQDGPLRIEITDGVIEPIPFAVPVFEAETPGAEQVAADISRLVAQDLANTGLFREIPSSAFISSPASFATPVAYPDWRAINAQALITGAVSVNGGSLVVKFRLYDVFSGAELGAGQQLAGTVDGWRRMAHKVADQVYSRITGESGYFDSRVVFVSESGPKDDRARRLAIMDYDGANLQYLTDSSSIVLSPRFSPSGDRVLYTSYASGNPAINLLQVAAPGARAVPTAPGELAIAARFSRDGSRVIYSASSGGNSDLWITDLATGQHTRLTDAASIETSPSFSPDGSQIVFESDRSGSQQLYIMPASGGEPRRISFGAGRYGSPVWSPRGDLIAFTNQEGGRFHIGVMRTDGSEERLLTTSFLDESPTWAPNGRVLMFTRETQGASGGPSLYSVDISGRNLRQVTTPGFASDASWGPLQN